MSELRARCQQSFVNSPKALTILALAKTIDTQPRVVLRYLPALDVGQRINRGETRVLGQCQGSRVQCLSECAHRVLLDGGDLQGGQQSACRTVIERECQTDFISGLGNGNRSTDFGSASSVHYSVVSNQVSDNADRIVQRSLRLVNDLQESQPNPKSQDGKLTILLLPRTNTVTALELAHSSMTSIFSLVVPNDNSRTIPAVPSLSAVKSSNRGTIRPLVAMAMSSISGPPTHRTAGKSFCINRWLASSSKPHWQMTKLAPVSLTLNLRVSAVA